MEKARLKRLLVGFIDGIISRLRVLWRELSSLRLGSQFGLVISENSIRLCLIRRRLHRSRIADIATFALNPDNAGNWAARIESAACILSAYLSEHKMKKVPINIGLLGEDIAFRRIYLPPMPRRELDAAVKWEGEKLFPFDFSQCSVDYRVAGGQRSGDTERIGINMVAAKSDLIEIAYDRFRAAGLKVGQIGYLPVFMASLLAQSDGRRNRQELIVYLNEEQSMAVFVRDGVLEFFQQFVTRPHVPIGGDATPVNLESLAAELGSFIDLYNGQGFGNTVHTVYMSGKFGVDDDTISFIRETTGLPCRPITDYDSLRVSFDHPGQHHISEYIDVIVTGLADPRVHPLAPEAVRKIEERKLMLVRTGVVAGLALLTAGSMQVQFHYQEAQKKLDLGMKKAVARAYEQSSGYQGYINLMGKLNRSRAIISRDRNHLESHFHLLLKELSLLLPDHVNLTSVDLDREEGKYILRLNGHVRLKGFSPEIILAGYVESLGESPFFDNVSVYNHNKKREQDRFNLTFQLKMDARV